MPHRIIILKEAKDCSNLDCGDHIPQGSPALRLQAFKWSEAQRRDVRCVVFYCASCVEELFPDEAW